MKIFLYVFIIILLLRIYFLILLLHIIYGRTIFYDFLCHGLYFRIFIV